MKFYRLLTFVIILSGYNTQAQTDTTKIQENLNENGITDSTKAPAYNLNENGIIDFWRNNTIGHEVNTVGEKGLLKKDESTFQSLLSGRVAGVTVVPGQAGLGSGTEIYIRGYHTINKSQQPLYIVDGIPYNNETTTFHDVKIDVGSRIADISIFDIESIEVVQNSSALAIYGSQAADGAILITTKKGKSGSKFNVSFSTGLTAERPLVLPKFQNSYGQGYNGNFVNNDNYSWGPRFNGQFFIQFDTPAYGWVNGQLTVVRHGDTEAVKKAKDLGYSTDLFGTEYIPYPNNVKDFFETAMSNANNVAISGSSERWNYRLSLSNHDLNGIVPNSGITKNNVVFNFTVAPLKFLTISSSFGYNTSSGKIANSNIMQSLTLMSRSVNSSSLKNYLQMGNPLATFEWNDYSTDNPYRLAYHNLSKQTNDAFNGNALFGFKLLKNWHLNYQLAIGNSKSNLSYNDLISSTTYQPTFIKSSESHFKYGNTTHNIYTTITIKPVDALNINALAGFTSSKLKRNYNSQTSYSSLKEKSTEEYSINNRAIFAQLNFKLLDSYFFEIQERNEKGMDNQSTFCYSALAGVSFKRLLKPTGIVSDATVRTSYGQVEGLNSNKIVFTPKDNSKDKTVELGFDLEFMSKHLLTATLFRTKSENTTIPWPEWNVNGLSELVGEIVYQGINLSATSNLLTTTNSSIYINLSFSRSISKLTKLIEGVEYLTIGKHIYKEGEQLSLLNYLVPMQHNGKIVYNIGSGKPVYGNSPDLYVVNVPDFTVNVAPTFRYKRLSVSILCSWQKGGKIFSNTIQSGTLNGTLKETDNREELVAIDGYTYDSQSNTYTPYTATISKEKYFLDNLHVDQRNLIVDASFFKIREASVSYQIDSPNKRYFQNISVSLIGRNLLLLAKQDHFDPETAFLGEENFAIPTTRSFSLQLTATF